MAGINKAAGMQALDAMLASAPPPPAPGGGAGVALDVDGSEIPIIQCGSCGAEIDAATGEPVEMVDPAAAGAPPLM